jgi:Histidine kinase-, DNA gyrase B-, and HSP90-like ATPase
MSTRWSKRASISLYHGARAEKQGFTITLERSFDPAAGEIDLFPQEITRALLNLISNGFYAATKRKAEINGGNYEPTLAATTKNLGDSVEIRIRDNGTGIPPEVKEKMFNPFFTTKPAGEGTGLGLSISHDIIVKQHGGSIEVDTQPGEFTEFRIVLPRAAAFIALAYRQWRASCQVSSRGLSGRSRFLLRLSYRARASAHQPILHTRTIVLLHQILPRRRAAIGTTALTGRKSSSAGTCMRSANPGNKWPLKLRQRLRRLHDCSRPKRSLR